ncbi:GMP synthase [Candidatus Mycoplasma haematobovis]|uniref:GMP synthase (glutamine-hydrolyzing) n=1 Tax=Candidatus Mycoplasma haematobovis TaxID=432608 RepID=A0A1A9QDY3_9MOLU|nr:glutamine-hydrolyzing GMP synthase [Candidatus Mycoplasma haematobovis]OAL10324.1 GMP synthase [Candidatus Mycoplasma haematobovis]
MNPTKGGGVLIIDFGSQYSQLIAKKIRDNEIYSEIVKAEYETVRKVAKDFQAIILSGSPESVENSIHEDLLDLIFTFKKPMLCICYGMQLVHKRLGGTMNYGEYPEFGNTKVSKVSEHILTDGLPINFNVWMSHNDSVIEPAPDFTLLAKTNNSCTITANDKLNIYTLQFHPEVEHSEWGDRIIKNFLLLICRLSQKWKMGELCEDKVVEIREKIGKDKVLLALSGGLDSSVVAKLLKKANPESVIGVFVDNGLLRDKQKAIIIDYFKGELKNNFHVIDAKKRFYNALTGIENPEEKRRVVGGLFLEIFKEFVASEKNIKYLAQGTILSDLIESGEKSANSDVIKTHHNTISELRNIFELIEPLSHLFKEEVRTWGEKLELPDFILKEHPFPGPGYAIRIMGEVTEEKIEIIKRVDALFVSKLKKEGLYSKASQAFAVLLNTKSVGVKGDRRSVGYVVALRSINTTNFMTVNVTELPFEFLTKVATEIVNSIPEISRVVYDLSTKPPSTIEWE